MFPKYLWSTAHSPLWRWWQWLYFAQFHSHSSSAFKNKCCQPVVNNDSEIGHLQVIFRTPFWCPWVFVAAVAPCLKGTDTPWSVPLCVFLELMVGKILLFAFWLVEKQMDTSLKDLVDCGCMLSKILHWLIFVSWSCPLNWSHLIKEWKKHPQVCDYSPSKSWWHLGPIMTQQTFWKSVT